jgi:catechol 2,3-dioxygenase-like lactoylglutathione lyase family enzyme
MRIDRLDHLVLTVRDIEATIEFYARALGMRAVAFGAGRRALVFGRQKINLHPAEAPFGRHARRPTPGSADLCFIASGGIAEVVAHLERAGVPLEEGPVVRSGALGPITSVYFRDPDENLIEVSCYEGEGSPGGA